MGALEKNATLEKMDTLAEKIVVGCKYVFTMKYNQMDFWRYKTCLVAKDLNIWSGQLLDFSPVPKLNTVRALLFVAAKFNWPLNQLNVENAF